MEPEELERYARHIVLHEIGGPGQQKLRNARVLVIGAGGLGSPALMYLAAAGVGTLGIVDDDVVSLSNLQRQVLHGSDRVGDLKVRSAGDAIETINPHVTVEAFAERLTPENARALVSKFDVVLDGSDNFDTRYLINETCVALKVPLVSAAMSQWEGQISLYDPANGTPCYACIFPERPAPGMVPTCAEAGVMGALAGVMGSLMATETIKHITDAGETLRGRLAIYDALYAEFRTIAIKQSEDCPVCGKS